MLKQKITVGISVYDRINEAKVSAFLAKNVLAEDFEVKVVVAACKAGTKESLMESSYIDFVLEPNVPQEVDLKYNIHSNLGAARTFSSFLKCGEYALREKSEFFCFGNAGSWIIAPNGIIELTSKLKNEKKRVACRVASQDRAYYLEDHFFLVNLNFIEDMNIFEGDFYNRFYNPIFFYRRGIHSLLENWINLKTKPGQVIVYSDLTNCQNHFGESVKSFVPFSIDIKRGFMHSNPFDCPDEILTLRIKFLETCDKLNDNQKKIVIDLLMDETKGKIIRNKIVGKNIYKIDSNLNNKSVYVIVRFKPTWYLISIFSDICIYVGHKFTPLKKFGNKLKKFTDRYSDAYDKIKLEKIQ